MQAFTFQDNDKSSPKGRTILNTYLARLVLPVFVLMAFKAMAGEWTPLARDGVHDPRSPAIGILQEPREALSKLTPDTSGNGNQVLWPKALDNKEIKPREKLFPKTEVRTLDLDVMLDLKGGMPMVKFPHRQHTEWLDCVNCHNGIFSMDRAENKISMLKILEGEQCGLCHGAVSFPLTECMRCHSVLRPGESRPRQPASMETLMPGGAK